MTDEEVVIQRSRVRNDSMKLGIEVLIRGESYRLM